MDSGLDNQISEKLRKVHFLLFDVDGVLTDGRIILGGDEKEYKVFNVRDGVGIECARRVGLQVGIITGRTSIAVRMRAVELGIDELFEGVHDKIVFYEKILAKYRVDDEAVLYMGDDLTDIPVLRRAGVAVTVPGAPDEVKAHADMITKKMGGCGAVREVIETILKLQGKWDRILAQYN